MSTTPLPRSPSRLAGAAALSLAASFALSACSDSTAPTAARLTPEVAMCCGGVPTWTPSELALPAGSWMQSEAAAMNDSGVVVGWGVDLTGFARPFRWANGVVSIPAIPLSGYSTSLLGINNAGDMVGFGRQQTAVITGPYKPMRWAQGVATLLPTLGYEGSARSINMSRVAVGQSTSSTVAKRHAVKWSANGVITDIHPAFASASAAYSINNAGDIVGRADFPDGSHAWKWQANGVQVDLGLTPSFEAHEVNNFGEAVGTIASSGSHVATMWTAAGASTVLTGVPTPSEGWAISDAHRVAGTTNAGGVALAFTFKGATFTLLPSLGTWTAATATDVNRCGHVVGRVTTAAGYRAARWQRSACDP